MKRRELGDRTLQEAAMRARVRIVQTDIEIGVEFYEQTARSFRKKIETQKKKYDAKPASYWEQDIGYGMTRGELESEQYQELQEMIQLNSYFGVLTVFAAFERLLLRTFQDMKGLELVKDKWEKKQPYLTLGGYKDSLKAIGIRLAESPFKWNDIIKLQDLRNAIAHQNGFVTEENIRWLRNYGYKAIGQRIDIDDKYFRIAVDLVKDSSSQLIAEYAGVFRKRGKRKKTH